MSKKPGLHPQDVAAIVIVTGICVAMCLLATALTLLFSR